MFFKIYKEEYQQHARKYKTQCTNQGNTVFAWQLTGMVELEKLSFS
jgi:hypothetical protein